MVRELVIGILSGSSGLQLKLSQSKEGDEIFCRVRAPLQVRRLSSTAFRFLLPWRGFDEDLFPFYLIFWHPSQPASFLLLNFLPVSAQKVDARAVHSSSSLLLLSPFLTISTTTITTTTTTLHLLPTGAGAAGGPAQVPVEVSRGGGPWPYVLDRRRVPRRLLGRASHGQHVSMRGLEAISRWLIDGCCAAVVLLLCLMNMLPA